MDEILQHFETMEKPLFVGICQGILPGFLGLGAGFRPSTAEPARSIGPPKRFALISNPAPVSPSAGAASIGSSGADM